MPPGLCFSLALRHLTSTACFARPGGSCKPLAGGFASVPLRKLRRVRLCAAESGGYSGPAGTASGNQYLAAGEQRHRMVKARIIH